ncbi:MAG: GDP-mannose 4,6-dehydratase [Candidatus Omnitrophica bacterium]|nr:GDP-mannose 4,6-dehydratase [Candidatus Omnitrophota bacterium]
MEPNKKFWENKRVLITGHEGFLGSHLTKYLVSCGAKIVGLDILLGRKNTVFSDLDRKKITAVKGNVANYGLLNGIIQKHRIEYVFHLAAEAIVGECLKRPMRAFQSNIRGTWSLLEACRNSGIVKAIVIASSDKAYGSHDRLPYKETYPLQGKHPYDVSKSCADLLAHAYFHTFGVPVVVTRCGNIYGPGEYNFSRIVPDSIRSIILNKPVIIRSDGNFTRDYVYVDDIVQGYLLLAQRAQKLGLAGEAFNFSTENPVTVLELVKKICRSAGYASECKILNQVKYEIKNQYLSANKARKVLGWRPKYSLEDGLERTIRWYRGIFKNA